MLDFFHAQHYCRLSTIHTCSEDSNNVRADRTIVCLRVTAVART